LRYDAKILSQNDELLAEQKKLNGTKMCF